MEVIQIYTDGSCLGNPGPGGWAAILLYKRAKKIIVGNEQHTTNNRMELLAAIKGLEAVKRPLPIHIFTDSSYLKDGITKWLLGWKSNGWKTANKKPVKNQDLWEQLSKLQATHDIIWNWVKAHNGNKYNEEVDTLAREAAEKLKPNAES
jgi:ribonuclease HI